MKKIMYVIAVAAAFLAVGCKKEKVNPEMPSVAWESNPTFGVAELTNNLEAVLTASAPANFQELKIVLGLKHFVFYWLYVILFSFLSGLLVNLFLT